jgi:outer membrane protein assembly factor BamB
VKQVKILFLIAFFLLGLVLASCVPGGAKPAQGWSGITLNDGILYMGSMDGKIMAVNPSARSQNLSFPADGEWEYPITAPSGGGLSCSQTSASVAIYGTPAVDEALVFIGGYNGKVYALNASARSQNLDFPQTRDNEWFYPKTSEVIGAIVGSPVVSEDAIYVTSSNGKVYSLDKHSGDKNWESDVLGDKLWSTPCIEGDKVYISTFDGHLYALSAEDGSITWSFATESKIGFVSSPAVYEGTIFAGSFDDKLYAVKIGESGPLWNFTGGNCFWAAPVVGNSTVYAGCLDGKLYAIDATNGTELWSPFDAGSPIVVSPILVDDSLVVAAESGNVYVINPKTGIGERIRNLGNDNKPTINALVQATPCVQEGIVYIRGQDNCLYALDIEQGQVIWKFPLTTQ